MVVLSVFPSQKEKLHLRKSQKLLELNYCLLAVIYPPFTQIMMAAADIWGFIGTALFFSRNSSSNQQSQQLTLSALTP